MAYWNSHLHHGQHSHGQDRDLTGGPFYAGLWVYFRNEELVFFHFLCCLYSIWQARLEQKAFRSLCCSCGLSCIRGRSSLDITSSCSVPRVAVSWSGFVLEKGIAELLDKRTQYIILKGTKFLNGEHFQSLGMCCFSLSKY